MISYTILFKLAKNLGKKMLTDISFKYTAQAQVNMYHALNNFSEQYGKCVNVPLAAMTATVDIGVDSIRIPAAMMEHAVVGTINVLGSPCSDNCNLSDAITNIKGIAMGILAGSVVLCLSPFKLCIQVRRAILDPKKVKSYNRIADKEASLSPVVFPRALATHSS